MNHRLLLCCLAASATLAAPTLEQADQRWTLRNEHLVCVFDRQGGGLPTQLTDAAGRPWWSSGAVYTDHGLFDQREYHGTAGVDDATLTSRSGDGRTEVTATGYARPKNGPASDLGYQVEVSLGDEPELLLTAQVTLGRSREQATGFLAAVFHLPRVVEWAADTVDGRVNELFSQDGRCYQSASLPLVPDRARVQVVYADGRLLTVEQPRAVAGPLSNLFLHRYGDSAALFFAWLDAGVALPWPAGQTWTWSARCRFGRLDY